MVHHVNLTANSELDTPWLLLYMERLRPCKCDLVRPRDSFPDPLPICIRRPEVVQFRAEVRCSRFHPSAVCPLCLLTCVCHQSINQSIQRQYADSKPITKHTSRCSSAHRLPHYGCTPLQLRRSSLPWSALLRNLRHTASLCSTHTQTLARSLRFAR